MRYRIQRNFPKNIFRAAGVMAGEKLFISVRLVPRLIRDNQTILRPVKVSDCRALHGMFTFSNITDNSIKQYSFFESSCFAWWWLRRTFPVAYCVEYEQKPIGFIGLYGLQPDKSSSIGFYIVDGHRRRGLGTRAFSIFLHSVTNYMTFEMLMVSIENNNPHALSFWTKMGFKQLAMDNSTRVLAMNLKS